MSAAQAEQVVEIARDGAVGVITMTRPDRRNALSEAMRFQLIDAFRELHADAACHAIVLTGAGGHFCGGGDISEMEDRPLAVSRQRMRVGTDLARMILTGPKPIVAAVSGAAAGAGVSLAAACDFVLASPGARFTCAFVKVGLLPDCGGLYSIPRRVGLAKAQELFGLCETIDAAEALRIGLANRIAGGDLASEAMDLARRYAALPPVTSNVLRGVMAGGMHSLEQAITAEIDHQPILRMTNDHKEAVSAFFEKRAPRFTNS